MRNGVFAPLIWCLFLMVPFVGGVLFAIAFLWCLAEPYYRDKKLEKDYKEGKISQNMYEFKKGVNDICKWF